MDITEPHRMDLANVYMHGITTNHKIVIEALEYLSQEELSRYEKYAKACEESIAFLSDLQMHLMLRAVEVSSAHSNAVKELTKP